MDLLVRILGNDIVHKIKELSPSAAIIMAGTDLTRDNVEGSEKGCGPVALISPSGLDHWGA